MNSKDEKYVKRVIPELNKQPKAKGLLDYIPDTNELSISEYTISYHTIKIKSIGKYDLEKYKELISIAIITATSDEKETVLENMEPLVNEDNILKSTIKNLTVYLGRIGLYPIILTRSESGVYSLESVFFSCEDLYSYFEPKVAILYGIAFGLKENCQNIGDVLISERIIPYERVKYHRGETIDRAPRFESSGLLKNRFKEVSDSQWDFALPNGEQAKAFFGIILSGEILHNDKVRRDELKSRFNEAIGGEMEGAGFAITSIRNDVNWIVVKGICDWGYNKGDENHKLACETAISLILTVFRDPHVFESIDIQPT